MSSRTRRPSLLAFAARARIMSIHDGNWIADARAGTLARTFLPRKVFPGTRDYHAFDVVVSGGNPLLAAVVLARAAAAGLDAALTSPGEDDGWPYAIAASDEACALVSAATGVMSSNGRGAAAEAVRRLVSSARGACFLPCASFAVSSRHPSGEIALYPEAPSGTSVAGGAHAELCSELLSSASFLPRAPFDSGRRTAVFARRLVLTALPPGMDTSVTEPGPYGQSIRWAHPGIRAAGTAARTAASGRDAVQAMVEDLIRCSRGEPLESLGAGGFR